MAKSFTVFHIKSTMEKTTFKREVAAKNLVAKLNAALSDWDRKNIGGYMYSTTEDYNTKIVHMVTRVNLRSGLEYQELSNTPCYMSPACESYWSM